MLAPLGLCILAPAAAAADRDWHAGLNLRTDLGVHQLRADGGVRLGAADAIVVLDPLYFADGELDLDALLRWEPHRPGWGLVAGWRTVAIEVFGERRFHEQALAGVTAALPPALPGVRGQLGVEVALLVVRHGAGLGTEAFAGDRRSLDLVNPGMFLRFEHARGF